MDPEARELTRREFLERSVGGALAAAPA